jgi:hypothetical protein
VDSNLRLFLLQQRQELVIRYQIAKKQQRQEKVSFDSLYYMFISYYFLGYGTIMLIIALISLVISFIFWCLGNAWILNKYQHVQYYNSTSPDYCYPPLFKGTFGIIIISDFWLAFFIFTVLILYISDW